MEQSGGLFNTGDETLETGIRQMLDLHVQQLDGMSNPRILKVGPGWGSLLRRLYDVAGD